MLPSNSSRLINVVCWIQPKVFRVLSDAIAVETWKWSSSCLAWSQDGVKNTPMPGWHEQHKHKDKINTKTKHDISSGTCEDKTTRIFLYLVICSVFGLCLNFDLLLMITMILMSQAWLHSFVLPFVLSLCLCLCVNQALCLWRSLCRRLDLILLFWLFVSSLYLRSRVNQAEQGLRSQIIHFFCFGGDILL